jgi:hypothetical protein
MGGKGRTHGLAVSKRNRRGKIDIITSPLQLLQLFLVVPDALHLSVEFPDLKESHTYLGPFFLFPLFHLQDRQQVCDKINPVLT